MVALVVPEGWCTIVTVAPATGWPLPSSTRPLTPAVVMFWAASGAIVSSEAMANGSILRRIGAVMEDPCAGGQ